MDPVAVPVPLAQPAIQPASQPSRPATAGRVQLLLVVPSLAPDAMLPLQAQV